ncbi:hypothetical protein AAH978_10005 [Streptomyces sp. ZYX-F-203]
MAGTAEPLTRDFLCCHRAGETYDLACRRTNLDELAGVTRWFPLHER